MFRFAVQGSAFAATVAVATILAAGMGAAVAQERNIRVSMTGSKDHPAGVALVQTMECAAAKTGGKLKMRGFYDGSLGSEAASVQQVRSGSQEAALTTTASVVGTIPQLAIFDLPFLIANENEADRLLDGKAGEHLSTFFAAAGLVNLGYWENGFRQSTNSRRPITRWEDFQGMKIRVIPNKVFIDTFSRLGANPVPMPFPEVYSALDSKAIDGQENPVGIVHAMKLFEVQKYLSMTRHVYSPVVMIYSKKLFDQLTPDEQKALRECAVAGGVQSRKIGREREAKSLVELKAKGMEINEVSPAEMARLREQVKPVQASQAKAIGDDTMSLVLSELERIRGK